MGAEGRAKTRSVPRPCSMARSFRKRRRPARRAPSGRPARSWASRVQSRHHWISSSPRQSAEGALLPLRPQRSAAHAERSATSSARQRPRRPAWLDRGAGSRFKNTPPTNAPRRDHYFSCFNQAAATQRQGRFWARRRKRRLALDFFSTQLWSGPRTHPAPARQLAAPPLPRQPRLRLPRHRARSDPSGLLQDDGPTRRLPHQAPSGGRVPRRRRLRVPGLRVRQTLRRLRLPLPSTSPEPPPRDQRPRAAARFPDIPQAQASRFPAEPSQASCFAWRGALIPARSSPRSPY